MSKIKIITDSTSDIPKEEIERLNITIIPLTVYFGDEAYKDGQDLSSEQFFEKLSGSNIMPTTSQVTPIEFEQIFRAELEQYETIICITLSSKASGTYQSAIMAKNTIDKDNIEIIDSMTFSYGYGMAVVKAAEMAQEGRAKEDIIRQINYMLSKLETYFIVDTLEYLQKGGRINMATAIVGNILNIKPILGVKDGLVIPLDKIRGSKRAINKMVKYIKEKDYNLSKQTIAIAHGAMPEKAEQLKEIFKKEFNINKIVISEVGSVIGAHAGPGVIGVFLLNE